MPNVKIHQFVKENQKWINKKIEKLSENESSMSIPFKNLGTEKSGGTKMFSVSGHVVNPGVFEVNLGASFQEVLDLAGGLHPGRNCLAVIPGGTSMRVVPGDKMLKAIMSYEGMEAFLMQKWLNNLGVTNFDYRVRHLDNTDFLLNRADNDFNISLTELSQASAILLLDAYPRRNQPLLNHRIRNAAMNSTPVYSLGYKSQQANYDIALEVLTPSNSILSHIAGLVKAIALTHKDSKATAPLLIALKDIEVSNELQQIANTLQQQDNPVIILGEVAMRHPESAQIEGRTICAFGEAVSWPVTSFIDTFRSHFMAKVN